MKIYQENIQKYNTKALELKKQLFKLSMLRLAIFIVSGTLLLTLFYSKLFISFFIALPIFVIGFAYSIKYYNKIEFLRKHVLFLKQINEEEILRTNCELEKFDTGEQFIHKNHPYTSDLDIFGPHSIFQLINRTTTESGTLLLSEWLLKPAKKSVIYKRQEAVKELSPKLDWRQDFQASGLHFQNKKSDYFNLLEWVKEPTSLLKHQYIYFFFVAILSVLSFSSFYFLVANLASEDWYIYALSFIAILIINGRILKKVRPIAEKIVETSQDNIETLKAYKSLINKIETESFHSERLKELKSVLSKGDYSAYTEINRFCSLLEFAQQRGVFDIKMPIKGNGFYSILNNFVLLDVIVIIAVEKWKTKNKDYLELWSEVVSEYEVISSFSAFSYSNPSYTFSEITDENNYVEFKNLGHPLINSKARIANDFDSKGFGDIVLITGSNMGGKSTFLRAVGVNIVLALSGAPCCAEFGKISILKVFTSMRTQDNLQGGISSFYAELNRIEQLLKLINDEDNVFFLLDEMFKGTNSEDRHKGGYSLIQQIKKLKTSGIIATHDIELAKLSEKKRSVKNYSFNSEIKGDSMFFDYKLHPGICSDFNASELMKRSGIEILSE